MWSDMKKVDGLEKVVKLINQQYQLNTALSVVHSKNDNEYSKYRLSKVSMCEI